MGALQPMPEGAVERWAPLLKEARSKAEYQRMQCVWLRATLGLNASQIAQALGWQASSVRHVQARYFREGEESLRDKPLGGRYHAHLTYEEEQELLAPFLEKAERGEIVIAAPVQQAYQDRLGHPVHHSVVYRALHRQGWRKIQPRPQHPKTDTVAQEEFKKSSQKSSKRKFRGPLWGPDKVARCD
jgi:transposase